MRTARDAHPAIRGKARELRRKVEEADSESLKDIPGWDTFTDVQKRFLVLLPWYTSETAAARAVDRSASWTATVKNQNHLFRQAVDGRRWALTDVIASIHRDLLGLAVQRLHDILLPRGAAPKVQLEAVQYLYRLSGMDPERTGKAPEQGNTFIEKQQVVHFSGPWRTMAKARVSAIEEGPDGEDGEAAV